MRMSNYFNIIPTQAYNFVRGKDEIVTWNWNDLVGNAHNNAFTIAKITDYQLLRDIKLAIADAIKNGVSGDKFRPYLEKRMKAAGWWGKKTELNPSTGQYETFYAGTPWRIDTIYRTNAQSAYMAGKWQRYFDNRADRPYLEYVAVLDSVTRIAHRETHGFIAPVTDKIWNVIFPPNGFNCRCHVRALTTKQAKGRNKGVGIPKGFPDTGFEGNPGTTADINNVKKLKATVGVKEFKEFISSDRRKEFLEGALPASGLSGASYLLNSLTTSGGDINLIFPYTKVGAKTDYGGIIAAVTAYNVKMYREKATGLIYVKAKGLNFKYYVFSPATGRYIKQVTKFFLPKSKYEVVS